MKIGALNLERALILLRVPPACHAGGRGFEPRHSRHYFPVKSATCERVADSLNGNSEPFQLFHSKFVLGFLVRKRYRRAMFSAILKAASAGLFAGSSRPDGLRAIRLFERLNGVQFDPFDSVHLRTVANSGWWFALQRRLPSPSIQENGE